MTVVAVVFALAFIALRVVPFAGAHVGGGVDTIEYRDLSDLPVFTRDFLGGTRPFGYPLFLKIVRGNYHVASVVQLILNAAAWLALVLAAVQVTRHRLIRYGVALVVLGLGLTLEAIQWDRVIGTESLSMAFGIGTLAALLWLYQRWTWWRVGAVLVLAFGATVFRDTNGLFLGVVAAMLLVAAALRRVPRRCPRACGRVHGLRRDRVDLLGSR